MNVAANPMPSLVAISSLVIIAALVLGVGIPNHEVLRHVVQTLPFWCVVVLGSRRSRFAGWIGLPLFLFWLLIMALIWMFLLGIAHVFSGSFTPWEIAMTIVVVGGCVAGVAATLRGHSSISLMQKAAIFILLGVIQFVCFRISFLPVIAHR